MNRRPVARFLGLFGSGVFVFLAALFSVQPARAISVAPTYHLFSLAAGESTSAQLVLTNDEPHALYIKPEANTWFSLKANQKIKTSAWLRLRAQPFTLQPGESRAVDFDVMMPQKVQGELCGVVSFLTEKEGGGNVKFRLSVAVYAGFKGAEKPAGRVEAMGVQNSSNTWNFAVLVKNEGNVHLRARGTIQLYDENDNLFANVFIEKGNPVMAGNTQAFHGRVRDLRLPPGKYTAVIQLKDVDRGYQIPATRRKFSLLKDGRIELR